MCSSDLILAPSTVYVLGVVRYGFHEWDASSSYGLNSDVLCSCSGEVIIVALDTSSHRVALRRIRCTSNDFKALNRRPLGLHA